MKKCFFAVLILFATVSQTIAAAPEKWSETTRDVAVVTDSAIYKIPFDTFYSQTMISKAPKNEIHQYNDTILLIPEPGKSIGTKNIFFIVTDNSVKAADLSAEIKLVGSSATDPLKTIKSFKLFANNKEYKGVKELLTARFQRRPKPRHRQLSLEGWAHDEELHCTRLAGADYQSHSPAW